MTDELLIAENGIELYASDVSTVCNKYRNNLENPELIYKSQCFAGMLEYVYKYCLSDILKRDSKYTPLNIDLYNIVFDNIYVPLCRLYNQVPTLLGFCTMVQISYDNMKYTSRGVNSDYTLRENKRYTDIVNHWKNTAESSLVNKTVQENGIGSIFILKAKYDYRDNNILTIEQHTESVESVAEIAERHKLAMLPDKPDLSEE